MESSNIVRDLATDPIQWRFNRIDGGPKFGVTVTALIGEGDMTFGFEINSLDTSNDEQIARADGFPEPIIETALKYLRGFCCQ